METLANSLLKIVTTVIIFAVPILCKPLLSKGVALLESKIATLDNEKAMRAYNNAVKILNQVAETVVMYLEQEKASEIRKKIADGTATREDLCKLKDDAVKEIKLQLTDSVKEIISSKISNLDEYIDNLVSEKVLEIKSK